MPPSRYGIAQESRVIWVYLEQDNGVFESVSLEMLAKGREMADALDWKVVGLLLGHNVHSLSQVAIEQGADEIWVADHPLLEHFTIEASGSITYQAIMDGKPSVFLVGATPNGRDLAGRLAVRLRTGLNADCTDLHMDADRNLLACEVSGFGGGIVAMIEMTENRPQMATVRPGVFAMLEPDATRVGKVNDIPVDLSEEMIKTRVVEREKRGVVDLTRVPVLVIGGRGVNGDFDSLKELAQLLGGDVGATRPPVDDGYLERERQIGQTGIVSRPKVAICCGVSGAFHLLVGIEKADTVISINSDPDAPIFGYSDYYLIGDVGQYLPILIKSLREEKGTFHA